MVERETKLKIILGDNSTHPVKGFGFVKFQLNSGESVLLHDVMYVPGLMKNLISISTLEDKGMKISFINRKFLTWSTDAPMKDAFTLGLRSEGLYEITRRPLLALVHNTNHLSELWHCRLAHLHYDALPKLKKLVSGIPDVQAHQDGVFQVVRVEPFPSSKNKTTDILHLIHSDICGSMPVHFIGGNLYYITFINDFSRNTWIYYLKHKDEAFESSMNSKP